MALTRPRLRRGGAAMEFLVIAPVLLLLLYGVVASSLLVTRSGRIAYAAHVGARMGAAVTRRTDTILLVAEEATRTALADAGVACGPSCQVRATRRIVGDVPVVHVHVEVPVEDGLGTVFEFKLRAEAVEPTLLGEDAR